MPLFLKSFTGVFYILINCMKTFKMAKKRIIIVYCRNSVKALLCVIGCNITRFKTAENQRN